MKRSFEGEARRSRKRQHAQCGECGKTVRAELLQKHLNTHNDSVPCQYCKKSIRSDKHLEHEVLCQSKIGESLCDRSGV